MPLTAKQALFPAAYIAAGFNATQACRDIGYKSPRQAGVRLIAKEAIQAELEKLYRRNERKIEANIDRVVAELASMSLSDITDVIDDGVVGNTIRVRALSELPKHVTAAIAEIQETQFGLKIKLHSKTQAIELLGRYLGMWREQHKDPTPKASDVAERLREALKIPEAAGG